MADITLSPLPPSEAVRFFEQKGYAFSFDWRDVWQQEHARAFTVAKVMRQDILETIRGAVDDALRNGTPFEEFQRQLAPKLQAAGWWGRADMTDPLTGEVRNVQLGSPRRLRIIFDTNLRSARAAGRWERIQRNKERRPYLRYSAILDSRTRPQHREWHSVILPIDHPFWNAHFPPNGWNCRCSVQQLSRRDLDRKGWTVSTDDDVQAFLDAKRYRNARTGQVVPVPDGIDPGFAFNVGKAHFQGAAQALGETLSTGDLAAGRSTLSTVINGESFTDFLKAPERWEWFPVGLLDDNLQARIQADKPVVFLSADTMRKQLDRHPEILDADYRKLPDMTAAPDLVIQDGNRSLVLIKKGDDWLLAAVKSTESGRASFVTSMRITRQADIDRILRRGGEIVWRKEEI